MYNTRSFFVLVQVIVAIQICGFPIPDGTITTTPQQVAYWPPVTSIAAVQHDYDRIRWGCTPIPASSTSCEGFQGNLIHRNFSMFIEYAIFGISPAGINLTIQAARLGHISPGLVALPGINSENLFDASGSNFDRVFNSTITGFAPTILNYALGCAPNQINAHTLPMYYQSTMCSLMTSFWAPLCYTAPTNTSSATPLLPNNHTSPVSVPAIKSLCPRSANEFGQSASNLGAHCRAVSSSSTVDPTANTPVNNWPKLVAWMSSAISGDDYKSCIRGNPGSGLNLDGSSMLPSESTDATNATPHVIGILSAVALSAAAVGATVVLGVSWRQRRSSLQDPQAQAKDVFAGDVQHKDIVPMEVMIKRDLYDKMAFGDRDLGDRPPPPNYSSLKRHSSLPLTTSDASHVLLSSPPSLIVLPSNMMPTPKGSPPPANLDLLRSPSSSSASSSELKRSSITRQLSKLVRRWSITSTPNSRKSASKQSEKSVSEQNIRPLSMLGSALSPSWMNSSHRNTGESADLPLAAVHDPSISNCAESGPVNSIISSVMDAADIPEMYAGLIDTVQVANSYFRAVRDDEMGIARGDCLRIEWIWSDGWAYGRNMKSGDSGAFPLVVFDESSVLSKSLPINEGTQQESAYSHKSAPNSTISNSGSTSSEDWDSGSECSSGCSECARQQRLDGLNDDVSSLGDYDTDDSGSSSGQETSDIESPEALARSRTSSLIISIRSSNPSSSVSESSIYVKQGEPSSEPVFDRIMAPSCDSIILDDHAPEGILLDRLPDIPAPSSCVPVCEPVVMTDYNDSTICDHPPRGPVLDLRDIDSFVSASPLTEPPSPLPEPIAPSEVDSAVQDKFFCSTIDLSATSLDCARLDLTNLERISMPGLDQASMPTSTFDSHIIMQSGSSPIIFPDDDDDDEREDGDDPLSTGSDGLPVLRLKNISDSSIALDFPIKDPPTGVPASMRLE